MKAKTHLISCTAALVIGAAFGYLPPVDENGGVRVDIGSFPQKIEKPAGNPYSWPLGVTEVAACRARKFPVTISNSTDRTIGGTLSVWMNDDWSVQGPQGAMSLTPGESRTLIFAGLPKPSALDALYPVHARFVAEATGEEHAPHPIAVFRYRNPNAPRSLPKPSVPELGNGVIPLYGRFPRTTAVEVGGKVHVLPVDGNAREWGGGMEERDLNVAGCIKHGFFSHPPYLKGAGFLWSDFPLDLPSEQPIVFRVSNYLVSHVNQPPSDGAEYRVQIVEDGAEPKTVATQIVKDCLVWRDMSADLSAWAGKRVTLRLWTGPGPKMNTHCDGGGWGEPTLLIGRQIPEPTEADWLAREKAALASAAAAVANGTDEKNGRWRLDVGEISYGAGIAFGPRGLVDGVIAFSDGKRQIAYRGFAAKVASANGGVAPKPVPRIWSEKGTLRIGWSIPGVKRDEQGFPRITRLAIGPSSSRPERVYGGFGNVIEGPKRFNLNASGFGLSTRHIGADYANGLSVVQAVDVSPDRLHVDGELNVVALEAHHDATYTIVSSSKGAFEAARRFRAVSGYKVSPGHAKLGSRVCLDQWSGDYAKAAADLRKAAKYGMTDAIFVKHCWQRWGYDYRLPEIYPPRGDAKAFCDMREACREGGILFCPHDNYTDFYPDAADFSYDCILFNLDGTPQLAWFHPWRHAQSYRWAPHAFHPWCLHNARLLKAGCDPDAIFIDVLTASYPFDYLDRKGRFHPGTETSAHWGEGFTAYRRGYGKPDAVCVSEAGHDHLIGIADAGESDHFIASKVVGEGNFADSERTPWHDIVSHGYYVLFAGGLGGRYAEAQWNKGGDERLHGYASDDYLSNAIIGGRNPMAQGPFGRGAVMTYYLQHDACAELGRAEFLDLEYVGGIHRQHSTFTDGGEVWINRSTNGVWTLPNGVVLPTYGYYAKTRTTTSGIVAKNGKTCAFSKSAKASFYDGRGVMTEFGEVATDGAFRLVREQDGTTLLIPLPEGKTFTAQIDVAALGGGNLTALKVEAVEAMKDAADVKWAVKGSRFTLTADARAFAYRIRK